ncbi:MAG TPA: HAD-IB family hydrolase [Candidatus Saccharimonadales bacterium]|nr:HAD-IB family hydrolase [Candidatus Saccharimonadales bacterium]
MSRPFAVFDIDGTLIRWQLYHALADELVRQGHLDAKGFESVRAARMEWKKRSSTNAFAAYEQALVELVDNGITGISVSDLQAACRTVIAEYKDQVYTYTRDLIRDLKAQNYLIFAISASQLEIVQLLAEYYDMDDYGGSIYEVDSSGHFTGQKKILKSEEKPKYLERLVEHNKATWQGSIAVGDSESDIPMLERVEKPIAFNPTAKLFDHAKSQDWPVVIERKNMIYRLETKSGSYQLQA